jgi:hypothetical protein
VIKQKVQSIVGLFYYPNGCHHSTMIISPTGGRDPCRSRAPWILSLWPRYWVDLMTAYILQWTYVMQSSFSNRNVCIHVRLKSLNPLYMKYTPSDGKFSGQNGYGYRYGLEFESQTHIILMSFWDFKQKRFYALISSITDSMVLVRSTILLTLWQK